MTPVERLAWANLRGLADDAKRANCHSVVVRVSDLENALTVAARLETTQSLFARLEAYSAREGYLESEDDDGSEDDREQLPKAAPGVGGRDGPDGAGADP